MNTTPEIEGPSPTSSSDRNTPESFPLNSTSIYNIKNLTYPEGLGENQDMPHYVSFFINIRGKSKFFKDSNIVGQVSNATNTDPSQAKQIVLQGATIAGAAIGAKLSKILPPGTSAAKKIAPLLLGGGIGASLASTIEADTLYRLSDVISLHINDSPSVRYGVKYTDSDIGTFLQTTATSATLKNAPEQIGALAAAAVNQFGSKNLNTALKKASGLTLNPFKEILFESIDYRTFKFEYVFMPQSEKETNDVNNIIETFKFHMHPELSANSFFFIHPSEFNIVYYFRGKENKYINRIANCALVDMEVSYGGQKFSTFDNGAPTEIYVSLKFQELIPVTKDNIKNQRY